jgi:N-succinyldiaminopimelate aminotransferase
MNQDRVESLAQFHPFTRLNKLLETVQPGGGHTPLLLSLGEPQFQPPAFALDAIANAKESWSKYPPTASAMPEFRAAAKAWLVRRYGVESAFIDADQDDRAGLGHARGAVPYRPLRRRHAGAPKGKGKVLMANPSLPCLCRGGGGGWRRAGLPAGRPRDGFPAGSRRRAGGRCSRRPRWSISARRPIRKARWDRRYRVLAALAGARAPPRFRDRGRRMLCRDLQRCATGRRHRGGARLPGPATIVLVFHSLSKRSSAPGMRSGFVAGDLAVIFRARHN